VWTYQAAVAAGIAGLRDAPAPEKPKKKKI
jgi:hypothetical protein